MSHFSPDPIMMEPSDNKENAGPDKRRKNASLLPLMSAPTPGLEFMCTEVIRHIVQFLDYRSKKMLRGVSSTLKYRVEGCGDKMVHCCRFSNIEFRTAQLKKFANEVETVLGFEVGDVTHDGVEYLVKKHPEILMFHLGGSITVENKEVSQNRLNVIFSIPFLSSLNISMRQYFIPNDLKIVSKQIESLHLTGIKMNDSWFLQILDQCGSTLRSLTLYYSVITGEIDFQGTLPCLENLCLFNCGEFTVKGLIQILRHCRTTLRSLDVSYTRITGENLAQHIGAIPRLENLNFSNCTDKEMPEILKLFGSTLKSLNIYNTNITGENLYKYCVTPPYLKNLRMVCCSRLTDKGLLDMLELCGGTLRSLDLRNTNISGENISEYKRTLPWLENLNMTACECLTEKGLMHILNLCGGTLISLNLSATNMTFENLSEKSGTLPCLLDLCLDRCPYLTSKGLLKIFHLCGSTLRSLDISDTNLTGENLSDFKGTLPCLEKLNIISCENLTDKGLWQMIQLWGSKLRSLDLRYTKITGEDLFEYNGTLPCLENLNLFYCKYLSYKGLLLILKQCGSMLRTLDISETSMVELEGLLSEYRHIKIYTDSVE